MFLAEPEQQPPSLIIGAPDSLTTENFEDELASVQFEVGDGIRSCGATEFALEMLTHGFVYELPITEQNEPVIECVIETFGSSEDQVSLHIKANNAQTH